MKQQEKDILNALPVLDKAMNNDYKKIYDMLKHNLMLLQRSKESTDEEQEMILLIIISELRRITSDIIEKWQIADS